MPRPEKGQEHGSSLKHFSFVLYRNETVDLGKGKVEIDGREISKKADDLRRKDLIGASDFAKRALIEYVLRHSPGNPSLVLEHWTNGLPFSEAAKEKLASWGIVCNECAGSGLNQHGGKCLNCQGFGRIQSGEQY